MLGSQLSELLHGFRLSWVHTGFKYILQQQEEKSEKEKIQIKRTKTDEASRGMKSLPDKEHHSAKGSCGQPPGASQLLGSWPFLEIFCSFPSSIRRKLCRRLTVNLSLGGGNGSVYNGAGSGSNRWNYAYGVVGRPTTRSGVGGLLLCLTVQPTIEVCAYADLLATIRWWWRHELSSYQWYWSKG